jgi:hypothetical protein
MIHSNVFTLPRPIVCLDGETQELFLKTGSLIFSETEQGRNGEYNSSVFSEQPIDEMGNVRILLDSHKDFSEPIYIGFPGETLSPFSLGFIESLKILKADRNGTLDLMRKLGAYGVNINSAETIEEAEIVFRFRNSGTTLRVETDAFKRNQLCPVPFTYEDLLENYHEGFGLLTGFRKALGEFYAVFRKPKRITVKNVYTICEAEFKDNIHEIVEIFLHELLDEYNTGIEFIIDTDD